METNNNSTPQPTPASTTTKYPSFNPISKNPKEWTQNVEYWIEEKIDGSQFSFQLVDGTSSLLFSNKGGVVSPKGMFAKIIYVIQSIANKLDATLVYHGEFMGDCRHNVIRYARIPRYYFVLYDISRINPGNDVAKWLTVSEREAEAKRIGLEYVKVLYQGTGEAYPMCQQLLEQVKEGKIESTLDGTNLEGFVVKVGKSDSQKLARLHKFVTSEFKEKQKNGLSAEDKSKMTPAKLIESIGLRWNTLARYRKACQHLRERAEDANFVPSESDLKDELDKDFIKEAKEESLLYLWGSFSLHVKKACRRSFFEYYISEYCNGESGEVRTGNFEIVKDDILDIINDMGAPYDNKERFDTVIESMKLPSHSFKNVGKISLNLDEDIEAHHMSSLSQQLWTHFGEIIVCAARSSFEEFFLEQ